MCLYFWRFSTSDEVKANFLINVVSVIHYPLVLEFVPLISSLYYMHLYSSNLSYFLPRWTILEHTAIAHASPLLQTLSLPPTFPISNTPNLLLSKHYIHFLQEAFTNILMCAYVNTPYEKTYGHYFLNF